MSEIQSLADRIENARLKYHHLLDQKDRVLGDLANAERELRDRLAELEHLALGTGSKLATAGTRRTPRDGSRREAMLELLFVNDALQAQEIQSAVGGSMPSVYSMLSQLRKEGLVERLEDHHWGLVDAEMVRRRAAVKCDGS